MSLKRTREQFESNIVEGHPNKQTKLNPNETTIKRILVEGDGNCLFRAILISLYRDDQSHKELRNLVCQYILKNKSDYSGYFIGLSNGLEKSMDLMKRDKTWGTILELHAASELLCFNYQVYYSNNLNLYCEHIHSKDFPTIILEYENGNHFNCLLKQDIKQKDGILNPNMKSFKTHLKSLKNTKKDQQNFDTKGALLKLKASESNQPYKKLGSIKIELKNSSKVHRTIYPLAKNDSNVYNEVYRYLNDNLPPTRFDTQKNKKGLENWKKKKSKKYELKKVSFNPFTSSRLCLKRENGQNIVIPFQDEIQKIIQDHHTGFSKNNNKHYGKDITLGNIRKSGLYWARMGENVSEFIRKCSICLDKKFEPAIKEKKVILSNKPLERIQGDLIELQAEHVKACKNQYKYIFSCVDHFSKFKWCYLINDKKATTIINCLENVFLTYGKPSIFQSDNGGEFKNKELHDFLTLNKVKFIHSSVRNPQAQGLVERHNRELKDFLKCSFENYTQKLKGGEWSLSLELENFRAKENNRYHIVTKHSPNSIIMTQDKKILQEVHKNALNYHQNQAKKQNQIVCEMLKKNTKIFIVKNVIPNKNHTVLDKPKKSIGKAKVNVKLPGIVVKDYTQNDPKVKVQIIASNLENLKTKNNYYIPSSFLSLPDEYAWEARVTKIREMQQ